MLLKLQLQLQKQSNNFGRNIKFLWDVCKYTSYEHPTLTVEEAAGEKSACLLLLGLNRKNKNQAIWKTDTIEDVSSAAGEFFTFLSW